MLGLRKIAILLTGVIGEKTFDGEPGYSPDCFTSEENNLIRVGETVFLITLLTAPLMWAYAFLAYHTIASPWPMRVGFAASIIHLLAPLLLRLRMRPGAISFFTLGSGLAHQATFSFFTGGFSSPIIVWF